MRADNELATDVLKAAIEIGYRHIDTADCYGLGNAESLIGKTLHSMGIERDSLFIATKGGVAWNSDNHTWRDSTPQYLEGAVKKSLSRLKTDYLDLYYLHWPDGETPLFDSLSTLTSLREMGLVRGIGISNVSAKDIEVIDDFAIDAIQIRGNVLETSLLEAFRDFCLNRNVTLIAHSALADGLLSTKFETFLEFSESDHRSRVPLFKKENLSLAKEAVRKLLEIVNQENLDLSSFSLAWLLKAGLADCLIVGSSKVENLKSNFSSQEIEIGTLLLQKVNDQIPLKNWVI
jgi:aryl-alcohol dehydrogenase-like predicted oxidoreductase